MSDFLEKQTQNKICNILMKSPGLHLSKIAELLNMPISSVEYHLLNLEKNRIIFSTTIGGYKQYYCKEDFTRDINNKILETRQKIFDTILKNPGLHQAKIAQLLVMRKSLAEYHLNYLEKNEAILSVKEEGYKRYYVGDSEIEYGDKKILALFRQKIPFKIVLLLLKNPILKHKDILKNLDISPSTLSYHLNKLVKQGVIEAQRYGDDKGYSIRHKKKLMKFLVRYEMDTMIENFKDMWEDLY